MLETKHVDAGYMIGLMLIDEAPLALNFHTAASILFFTYNWERDLWLFCHHQSTPAQGLLLFYHFLNISLTVCITLQNVSTGYKFSLSLSACPTSDEVNENNCYSLPCLFPLINELSKVWCSDMNDTSTCSHAWI